jgi:hypothetical protein
MSWRKLVVLTASVEFTPLLLFTECPIVGLEMYCVYPWVGYLCLGILVCLVMLLHSRGVLHSIFGLLVSGCLLYLYSCSWALFSPDDLFALIEGFWRLAVFNEA